MVGANMDKNELKWVVNHHPDIVSMKKTMVIMLILLLIGSIVLLIVLPVAGFIGLCLWPILLLCYWGALSGKKKNVRKQIEQNGVNWEVPQRIIVSKEPTKNSSTTQSRRVVESNSVVDMAASYAIGKAVTNKTKQSPLAENPYQKNQTTQTTTRANTSKYVSKMGKTHQCCGTCQFWSGSRELDAVNHGRIANIISKDGKCACKTSSYYRVFVNYNKTCGKWEKWPDLR